MHPFSGKNDTNANPVVLGRGVPLALNEIPIRPTWPWAGWILLLGDVIALEVSLWLAHWIRLALAPWLPIIMGPSQYQGLVLGMLILPLGYWVSGLYPGYGIGTVEQLRRRTTITLLLFGVLTAWEYLLGAGTWSRGILLLTLGFALIIPPLISSILREILLKTKRWGKPVVILGAARTGALIARLLGRDPNLGLHPVAFLDDDVEKHGGTIEAIPIVGSLARSSELANRGVKVAVLAMPGLTSERLVELSNRMPFAQLIAVPGLFGIASLWVSARDLGGVIGLEIRNNLLSWRSHLFKQILDYVLGLPLFLLSLPIIGIFALWIRLISPGSPFYTQEREGFEGKPIKVFKLRTMYRDAETRLDEYLNSNLQASQEWAKYFKLKQDPRVLPVVGKLLRKTSLDELPQLFNVLRGEMSLVGPRPFPHYHLVSFPEEFRALRRRVLPGMTGLWQVSARSEGDIEVQQALDTYYIRNWSLWLDIYLLARTITVVLGGKGAY